jgi:hypothetical protein
LKRCKVVDGGRRARSNEFIAMVLILFLILLRRRSFFVRVPSSLSLSLDFVSSRSTGRAMEI